MSITTTKNEKDGDVIELAMELLCQENSNGSASDDKIIIDGGDQIISTKKESATSSSSFCTKADSMIVIEKEAENMALLVDSTGASSSDIIRKMASVPAWSPCSSSSSSTSSAVYSNNNNNNAKNGISNGKKSRDGADDEKGKEEDGKSNNNGETMTAHPQQQNNDDNLIMAMNQAANVTDEGKNSTTTTSSHEKGGAPAAITTTSNTNNRSAAAHFLAHHVRAYSDISPIVPVILTPAKLLQFDHHHIETIEFKAESEPANRTHSRENSDTSQLLMTSGETFVIPMSNNGTDTGVDVMFTPHKGTALLTPPNTSRDVNNGGDVIVSTPLTFNSIYCKNGNNNGHSYPHKNGFSVALNNSSLIGCGTKQNRPFRPKSIQYQNIRYEVPVNRRKDKKSILKSVSGEFRAGYLHAILGPSGAGKSTLMNVLAGYKIRNMTGTVLVNGKPRDLRAFRKMSCYIMQDDHLLPQLTVMEAMMCSANLKLPESTPLHEKRENILEILETLGLRDSSSNRTGNLSGGQRKRLSIALELINNPPIMFLDEPTSGLDSVSCYQCVQLLKRLALGGRNIICTIHQPSAKVFEIFDTVYMMADGQAIYDGPVSCIVPYFALHNLNCPPYHNPSDFIMEVATGDYGDVVPDLAHYVRSGQSANDLERIMKSSVKRSVGTQTNIGLSSSGAFHGTVGMTPSDTADTEHPSSGSRAPSLMDSDSASGISGHGSGAEQGSLAEDGKPLNGKCSDAILSARGSEAPRNFATSIFTQFRVLFIRTFITILRDTTLTQVRFISHTSVAILIGLLYLHIGNDASKVVNNAANLFVSCLFLNFGSLMPTILTFPNEVFVFLREHLNYWYSLKAYYLAKTVADMPFQIFLPIVYTVIVYFMTGQPVEFLRFFLFTTLLVLTCLVAQSLGLLISALSRAETAVYLGPMSVIPVLLFSGFLVTFDTMPIYFQWLSYFSYMRYSFEGAMQAIYGFNRTGLTCDGIFASPDSPDGPPSGPLSPERVQGCVLFSTGDAVLQSFSLHNVNVVVDIAALLCFFVFFRLACYFALRWRVNRSK